MWVLSAHDGASAEHHLVLRQSASFVREDVLDLPQVLRDVEGLTLDAAVALFVVQVHVISDEEDLADLHHLNGDVEGDGNQDLKGKKMEFADQQAREIKYGIGNSDKCLWQRPAGG